VATSSFVVPVSDEARQHLARRQQALAGKPLLAFQPAQDGRTLRDEIETGDQLDALLLAVLPHDGGVEARRIDEGGKSPPTMRPST
jgi:hypothetical protein